MGPLLPMLRRSNFCEGVDPVRFLEKFCKHAEEIGYALLTLIYGRLLESLYRSMKDGTLKFTIVPHKEERFPTTLR